jgi:hypothetical protein
MSRPSRTPAQSSAKMLASRDEVFSPATLYPLIVWPLTIVPSFVREQRATAPSMDRRFTRRQAYNDVTDITLRANKKGGADAAH